MRGSLARRIAFFIWPAFLIAAAADAIFFTFIDPLELRIFGAPLDLGREAIYAIGFFVFWGLGLASSALRELLDLSALEVNRGPLRERLRAGDCPRTEDSDWPPDDRGGRV